MCYSFTGFIRDSSKHAKLGKHINCRQNMSLVPLWSHICHQVNAPFTPWASRQRNQLPLPTPMGLATAKLAFKAAAPKLSTVLPHPRPIVVLLQQVEHLLPTYVMVGHVDFLHEQHTKATCRKRVPLGPVPVVELVRKAQALCLLLKRCSKRWWGLASKQEVLELQVFCWALYPTCLDVAGTLPAVPVGGGNTVEVCATQVVRPIAGVTHQGVWVICREGL